MTKAASLVSIPFELTLHICKYLPFRYLKILRLAFPRSSVVSTAAASILFHTITLRLGNHYGSLEKIESLSSYARVVNSRSQNGVAECGEHTPGIFRYAKKLVLDARYPFIVDEPALRMGAEEGRYRYWEIERLRRCDTTVADSEQMLFFDAVESIVHILSKQLNELQLRISDVIKRECQERIMELVCRPRELRSYRLTILQDIRNRDNLDTYLQPIENADSLNIQVQRYTTASLAGKHIDSLTRLIQKNPFLKSLSLNVGHNYLSGESWDEVWNTIASLHSLRTLSFDCAAVCLPKAPLTLNSSTLQRLEVLRRKHFIPEERFLDEFAEAGIRLKELAVTYYNWPFHERLKAQKWITHLELQGEWRDARDIYGQRFWTEVFPVLKGNIQKLIIFPPAEGTAWIWTSDEECLAKAALRGCNNLEDIMVGFWNPDTKENHIIPLIEDLIHHCPKVSKIQIPGHGYEVETPQVTEDMINTYEPHEELNHKLLGRELELLYTYGVKGRNKYTKSTPVIETTGDDEEFREYSKIPLIWDYCVQKWRLERRGKEYRFIRELDEYCFEE